ncbi:tyrosine-type recombinase/integrase [Lysinibacillus sp. NPDC097287]|uniref:tyrosine-type recombinase/integrase n=1 Tax=Lysinibacillus sp. NPDC097287 TaxID=3364144 RepID=UPI0037F3D941
MENIINSRKTLSNINKFDPYYQQLIEELLLTFSPSYSRSNINLVLNQLYEHCLEDPLLRSRKNGTLLISEITLDHILKYQHKIELRVNKYEISKQYGNRILSYVRRFCEFLTNKRLINLFYKPVNFLKSEPKDRNTQIIPLLSNFMVFLDNKNYASFESYIKHIKRFLVFSSYNSEIVCNEYFWEDRIKKYEVFLRNEVIKEKILSLSAYIYLKCIRTFYDFLYEEKIISFKYKIPKNFEKKGNRNNEFIPVQDLLILIDTILERSSNTLRDISIFLILLETGCRHIEVANLEIDDVVLAERLITLKSKKSHQRTLKISKDLVDFIQAYLKIRCNYLPDAKTKTLFLKLNGTPITSTTIYDWFKLTNIRAFGKTKFSPRSLRHTFITNALNNKNDIKEVAQIAGHKTLSVTMGYFYRDLERIKEVVVGKELNFD